MVPAPVLFSLHAIRQIGIGKGSLFVKNIAAKKKVAKGDPNSLNSKLIRRPIQRCFPLFLLPTFAAFIIGFLVPFVWGIYLSFCKFNTPRDATWVGFANYLKIFKDPGFISAFKNTAMVAVVSVVVINVIAFAVAYALTQKVKGANIFRTVFFMPNLIGGVVLGYIWKMIFDGILSAYSTYLTANATYGFWGLIILLGWQQIGYMMIIYIAGLQAVPGDMLEAATIDGANRWQTLWKVIIPNVMPSITICVFLTLTNSFKLYDQNMALTGGLPAITMATGEQVKATEMLALNILNTYNIGKNWHGVAQAKAVIFFILVAVLALAQLRFTRSKEVQQ